MQGFKISFKKKTMKLIKIINYIIYSFLLFRSRKHNSSPIALEPAPLGTYKIFNIYM